MKNPALVILTTLFTFSLQAPEKAPFNDAIRKEVMRADVFFLAGDAMLGRLTDTPANFIAEEYVKSRFEAIGLKPAGSGNSYFHHFYLMTAALGDGNSLEVASPGNATLRFHPGLDYYPHFYSASAQVRGQVVFAGFGITAPDLDYDDYRGQDLGGKVVWALNDEPGEQDPNSPFDGVVRAEVSSPLRKALFAQAKGAVGILFVRDIHNHPAPSNFETEAKRYWPDKPPRIQRYTLASWAEKVRIPVAEISPGLAEILIKGCNRPLKELCQSSESKAGIAPLPLPGVEVSLAASVRRHIVSERNVVGILEGSDPKLKDEHIIICGHHDHNGAEGELVYPGADDNVSGVVGTIGIAEAYAQAMRAGKRPRRSMIFASWEAEERGLLGAWAYTEDPFLPLEKTAAVLNLDLIGRSEEVPEGGDARFRGLDIQTAESNRNAVNLVGTVRSPDLKAEAERANRGIGLELRYRYDNNISNLLRRSDHWPFIQRGVPAVWIFTGLHPDYHTIYDRPEKIDYGKMERIVRLVHQMSWDLAQQEARPALLPRKNR